MVKMGRVKRLLVLAFGIIAGPIVFVWERLCRPHRNTSAEVRSILVLEYWNLGDMVMELAFLRNLRIHYPKARIVLLTSPKVAPLVEHQGVVDRVIPVRVPWTEHYSRWRKYNPFSVLWISLARTLRLLHAQRFDLAFSARADLRENLIMWLLNARRRVGYGFGGGEFFLTDIVAPDLQHPHFSERWLRLLEHLGKPILVQEPSLHISDDQERFAEEFLAGKGISGEHLLIGIHAGARSATRQWGEANFAAVAERLQAQFPVQIVWFEDPHHPSPDRNRFMRFSLPLRSFIAVLSRCQLLICNDSGPMHIATALAVPVIAVFGPTEPTWFGPRGQGNQLVIRPGVWCRPCFDYCLFHEPYCLRTITVESVFETAAKSVSALLRHGKRLRPPVPSTPIRFVSRVDVRPRSGSEEAEKPNLNKDHNGF